jgi:hypothetical protein
MQYIQFIAQNVTETDYLLYYNSRTVGFTLGFSAFRKCNFADWKWKELTQTRAVRRVYVLAIVSNQGLLQWGNAQEYQT